MRAQFRIVDLLWLLLVCFFATAWWVDHRRFVELQEALKPAQPPQPASSGFITVGPYGASGYADFSSMNMMPGYGGESEAGGMPGMGAYFGDRGMGDSAMMNGSASMVMSSADGASSSGVADSGQYGSGDAAPPDAAESAPLGTPDSAASESAEIGASLPGALPE